MDNKNKKKKKKSNSPFDIWPPPRDEKKQLDPRERMKLPRNKSYVDFEQFIKDADQAIYEEIPEEKPEETDQNKEKDDKDNQDEKKDQYRR
jgi:hypothetical protein